MISDDDIAAIRHDGDLPRYLRQIQAAARAECQRRRSLVLRYPELAEQLTQPPHHWSQPDRWNGFIPPDTSGDMPNRAPVRQALLDLVTEAEARDAVAHRPAA